MISIRSLHIQEFRGIRDLILNFDRKNFGICGPNGTGKSGVVDAIEFCLTGDVTRLSGAGSAGLSVKAHAPHVDRKDEPERAKVTIVAHAHALNTDITITRSVKQAKKAVVTPSTPQTTALIQTLESHPEFALSRREIVKYVNTPAGDRSRDVQTLLRLDHLEKLRQPLTTFANNEKKAADNAERQRKSAEISLCSALGLQRLEREQVLTKVNEQRALISLEPITELRPDTSFKQGMIEAAEDVKTLRKAPALADLASLQTAIQSGEPVQIVASRQSAILALGKLSEDERLLTLARQRQLVETGIDLITSDICPLCDTAWNQDELREHLRSKLLTGEEVRQLLDTLHRDISAIRTALSGRKSALARVQTNCAMLGSPVTCEALSAEIVRFDQIDDKLSAFLTDSGQYFRALDAIRVEWWMPPEPVLKAIDKYWDGLNALPDPSAQNAARDLLSVAQERYEQLLMDSKESKSKKHRATVAACVLQNYLDSCDGVLASIYDTVADDFADFYRIINHDDEAAFKGRLTPEPAKLHFDVDFYGRGLFPPGAYHSEGHQDGMGLCLYLALMKHTLGDAFTFSVLDDVLMSVDAGHRRDVCRLLTTKFPHTQFVITTHDRVWLQYMKTERLIFRSQMFGAWTVDAGPRVWDDRDVWVEIDSRLDSGDVETASALLRRYLEYTATVLADNFRAQVEFRGDGQYDLGSLLSPALARWVRLLEKGQKSAKQWQRIEREQELGNRRAADKALIAATNIERWAINPAVHYNAWANFQPTEFRAVVDAFRAVINTMQCTHCQSFPYVVPYSGPPEEFKCNCGSVVINLKEKT